MNRRFLLVLALVVALAATQLTGCSLLGRNRGGNGPKKQMSVLISIKEVEPGMSKQFHVGETVREKDSGIAIGRIVSAVGTPSIEAVPTSEGKLVGSPVPNLEDVFLTIEGTATEDDDGYRFNGFAVYVNQDIKALSPFVSFTGRVQSMKETGK